MVEQKEVQNCFRAGATPSELRGLGKPNYRAIAACPNRPQGEWLFECHHPHNVAPQPQDNRFAFCPALRVETEADLEKILRRDTNRRRG